MNFNITNLASALFSVHKNTGTQKNAPANKQTFSVSPSNQEMLSNMNARQIEGLYARVTQAATNIMSNMQQNIFMRDMLGLPKDWTQLLNEFILANNSQITNMIKNLNTTGQNSMQDALLALLAANSKVDLASLAAMINKNAALMSDKLLKYMGAASMSQNNIAQLKDIMLIGASIANSANVNPNEFIRDIIQMYLPWLPLVPPKEQDLNEIQEKMGAKSEGDAEISFYISTTNIGYFKIEILTGNEIEIYINNVYKKEIDELKENLINTLKENIKKTFPDAKLYYSGKIDPEELSNTEKQLYIIKSSDSMSGLVLLQLIPKIIFEFDETQAQRFLKAESNS